MTMERSDRIPLFVPVVAGGLTDCWTENISLGGIALVGRHGPEGPPQVGSALRLQVALPDQSILDLQGEVAWVAPRDSTTASLGLFWLQAPAEGLERIARLSHQPACRVVVVGASSWWRNRLIAVIGAAAAVDFVDAARDVPAFDVAVIVRCDEVHAVEPRVVIDEAPRQLVAGAFTARVQHLLRSGAVAGAIDVDDADEHMRDGILSACRDWNSRQALRRTTLRLARELHTLQHSGVTVPTIASPDGPPGGQGVGSARVGVDVGRGTRSSPGGKRFIDSGDLVAESPAMTKALEAMAIVAPRKVVVLIEGETGSGKGLMARTVHQHSTRKERPFIVQDCGTLTDTLLDSELFGHVRGAFTGANADHPGIFVIADGGTVFLDEIQNTSASLQAKLLRVIETGEVRPVGGSRTRVTDVRIIAAANTDLEQGVRDGRFRADLYYRLTVFPIRLPPLRERGRDVLVLARRLAATAATTHGLPRPTLSDDVEAALLAYSWPGNVRQLKNVLERAVLLAGEDAIAARHLPSAIGGTSTAPHPSLDERVRDFERGLIVDALKSADGVVVRAAEALRTNRVTLARKARGYGLLAP